MHNPDPLDDLDDLRRDLAALEAELVAAGSTRKGKNWQCANPAHPDNNPSAWNYADAGGTWRHKCGSCGFIGDLYDVRAAVTGKPLADVLREARAAATPPAQAARTPHNATQADPTPNMVAIAKRYYAAITAAQRQELSERLGVSTSALDRLRLGWCARDGAYSFPMRSAAGEVRGIRLRCGDKKYAETGGHDGLFIPADLTGGDALIICEGPTDLAAVLDCGMDGIGRPNNASTTAEDYLCDWLTAHPYREVWIIHDADPDGSKAREATTTAAQRLARRLVAIVGAVRVFAPPAEYKDVRAWRLAGADLDDLTARADEAEAHGPAADLRCVLEAEIDGTRRAVPMPWRLVCIGTQGLLPGAVLVLCGEGGAGKTFWKLQAAAELHDAGVPIAIFELEQDRSYHLRRLLAQRVGASWLTDLDQVKARPADVLAYHAEHAAWLDDIGRRIDDAPTVPVSLAHLTQWVQNKAEAGARVLFIDPVTAATTSDRPWDDAQKFLHTVIPILDRTGSSLFLVTHPRKRNNGGGMPSLDDVAGGAAWGRFSHTVLMLTHHRDPKSVTVRRYGDPLAEAADITRTLRILKARNGKGGGWALGYELAPGTLRFTELGAIVKATASGQGAEL